MSTIRTRLARLTAASAVALSLGMALAASPVAAATSTSTAETAPGTGMTDSAASVVDKNCNAKGTCIYVTHSGFHVSTVKGTGHMVARGCIYAKLLINRVAKARTATKCFARGTAVFATFSINRTFTHGDEFAIVWVGAGGPPGPYPTLYFV